MDPIHNRIKKEYQDLQKEKNSNVKVKSDGTIKFLLLFS